MWGNGNKKEIKKIWILPEYIKEKTISGKQWAVTLRSLCKWITEQKAGVIAEIQTQRNRIGSSSEIWWLERDMVAQDFKVHDIFNKIIPCQWYTCFQV